jgi:hypothetical protein
LQLKFFVSVKGYMKIPVIIFTIGFFVMFSEFTTLEDLRWEKRILLVFPESSEYELEFSDSLKNEMDHRDMVYFIFADSIHSNTDFKFDGEYVQQLKSRYLLGSKSACWVLLGKDGGVKLRLEEALDLEQAFAIVDEMPLRTELVSW